MKNDCILCSFQKECSDGDLFLYAATPILRQILASTLTGLGAEFRVEKELFRVSKDPKAAIEGLRGKLNDVERADIRVSRERGAGVLSAVPLDDFGKSFATEWFDEALENDTFTTFFQPIVNTRGLSVFAHECLIRLFADRPYNGGEIMEAAVTRGRLHVFDAYARRLSIRCAGPQFIPGTKVFINFMPSSIYDPAFCMASTLEEMSKTTLKPSDIIFEVVESDTVRDVKHLQNICDYYRKNGFGFALDDVGTGSSSLQMACDLKPDFIKLDKSLIWNVSQPMYRSAVEKLAEFAEQFGVHVIAEGIEDARTMEILQEMGIYLMQGYYFAKPADKMKSQISSNSASNDLTQIANKLGKTTIPETLQVEKPV